MQMIVVTGGPCAAKTTVKSAVEQEFGDRVTLVAEAATILLSGGFPLPGRDLQWSQGWQIHLQGAIVHLQRSLEHIAMDMARHRGHRLLVCDRGLLDGASYLEGGLSEFCERFKVDVTEAHKRYSQVIHLESLATSHPERYGRTGNESRFEPLERAQHLERAVREAWRGHPRYTFIGGEQDVGAKVSKVLSIIRHALHVDA